MYINMCICILALTYPHISFQYIYVSTYIHTFTYTHLMVQTDRQIDTCVSVSTYSHTFKCINEQIVQRIHRTAFKWMDGWMADRQIGRQVHQQSDCLIDAYAHTYLQSSTHPHTRHKHVTALELDQ